MYSMRSGGLVNRLLQDTEGGALLEFTLVFPILVLVALGTVDFTYLLFDQSLANKAAFAGARMAVVSDPVATGITNLTYSTAGSELNRSCYDATGGVDSTSSCPTVATTCTPAASNGSCTNGYAWAETAFTKIFDRMHGIYPQLRRQTVRISYKTTGLGFVGRPNGLPMSVTVSIQGMTHQFYFIGPLARIASTPTIPAFATTLTSEDMCTSDNINTTLCCPAGSATC
jgi:Flp pilus assembly protein TadG